MASSLQYDVFRGNKSGEIYKSTTKRGPLQKDQVLVKITHSGVCYTDVHYRKSGIVLGHEGVGIVEQVGPDVQGVKLGQHVGWPYQRDTCGHCEQCLLGEDMHCPEVVMYGEGDTDQGSFASHIVIREPFLINIPESIPLEFAGPLMCGGITVFEAMFRFGTKSTDRVGVMGLGGLGHLAVQFLSKMGCQVVVFSSTDSKKDEAFKLGASEFYVTKGKDKLEIGRPLNQLFDTTSAPPNYDLYVPILAPRSTIYPLVVDSESAINVSPLTLNLRSITIQGSGGGRRFSFLPMFAFVAQHNIKPLIEKFEFSEAGITEAFERLMEGSLRYRAVLEWK
ncbi:chaperonin 10-like protein [Flagelloscypha sp. PMI_526]|nr:chaperonin 10-like protein [Flagelloscypha sp. PMI_526]